MKFSFSSIKSLKEIETSVLVSVLNKKFVNDFYKKNGKCDCGSKCKCGKICLCKKTPLQQAIYDSNFEGEKGQSAVVSTNFGKIIFFGIGEEEDADGPGKYESVGYSLYKTLKSLKVKEASILFESSVEKITFSKNKHQIDFLNGILLGGYDFTKYMSKDKSKSKEVVTESLTVLTDSKELPKLFKEKEIIAKNVFFCRDLINEPANVLYPESYVEIIKKEFKNLPVKIEVLDEKQLKKIGANSLLAVSQGSVRAPFLVSIEYNGGKGAPVAFVGKGVCFDSGGLSLKPSSGTSMEMKEDMSGSAVVVSTLKLLAERKAKVNAVGVVALVENMPSGTATKIQDIVKSLSGQTIEILNTDAEGRLILADALYYTATKFKPQTIIDLATLTGAICVALGDGFAGNFSNSEELDEELKSAAKQTTEYIWKMPLSPIGEGYDKMIDSDWADMKNVGGRDAGSITAAQFLQRFINKHSKWAHLDIASVAFVRNSKYFVDKGATGWGVRLLNELIKINYEKKV
ncbi:MAG: leucyl aminopeptidase [Rickettsiales bacterium]|jgi:leucyl aminopeptidase|nr:leucyl aminopeptidase [Rickettsiales bacterium]